MKKSIIIMLMMVVPMMLNAQMPMRHYDDMGHGKRPMHDMYEMRGIRQLDLTEKQEEQLHTLKVNFKKATVKMMADMKLATIELHELMRNDVTGSKLDKAIGNVTSIKNQLFKSRINHHVHIRKLLTDEQKKQLKELRNDHRNGYRGSRDKAGPRKNRMKRNMK